jgi:hypothetical protein
MTWNSATVKFTVLRNKITLITTLVGGASLWQRKKFPSLWYFLARSPNVRKVTRRASILTSCNFFPALQNLSTLKLAGCLKFRGKNYVREKSALCSPLGELFPLHYMFKLNVFFEKYTL